VAIRIDVDAQLTDLEESRIELLRHRRAEFDATWRRDRGSKSRFPFRSGRTTDSEYEGSIAFFLRASGWGAQAIMNAIAAWNRLHGIQIPAYASRYGATISKAFTLAKLYSEELAPAKTKGCWAWGETRARVLAAIQAGPRRPKELGVELGIHPVTTRGTLNRLVKDGLALHVGHEYLAAPLPVVDDEVELAPPEDAEVDLDYLYADYEAWIAAGGLEAIEEEIEAPEMVMHAPAAVIKSTLPDFNDYVEPELVTQPAKVFIIGFGDVDDYVELAEPRPITIQPAVDPFVFSWPDAVEEVYVITGENTSPADRAQYRRADAEREIRWNKEGLENRRKWRERGLPSMAAMKREAKAKKKCGWARLPAGPLNPNGDRLLELEAERARLRHLDRMFTLTI
jgi:hypothetical protein